MSQNDFNILLRYIDISNFEDELIERNMYFEVLDMYEFLSNMHRFIIFNGEYDLMQDLFQGVSLSVRVG
jgi:hypothetical protein